MNWKKILIKPTFCAAIMGLLSLAIYKGLLLLGIPMKLTILIVMPIAVVIYFIVGVGTHTIVKEDLSSIPGGRKLISLLKL